MKRLLCLCLVVAILSFSVSIVKADNEAQVSQNIEYDYDVDYMAEMLTCSGCGTAESLKLGVLFEQMRNEKIEALQLPYATTHFFTTYTTADQINCAIRDYLGLSHKVLLDAASVDADAEPPQEEAVTLTVSATVLNCRQTPDSSAQIVKKLTRGQSVTLLETSSGWCHVTDGQVSGWCWGSYLSGNSAPAAVGTLAVASYTQEDLYWLALAITMEAGSSWLSDEHQLLVGNVILNRAASGLFADTIYGVIHQAGQYSWVGYATATPTERAYANAKRLLNGERFCPSNVLFQAQFIQGSGIFTSIYDATLGTTTYFCYV